MVQWCVFFFKFIFYFIWEKVCSVFDKCHYAEYWNYQGWSKSQLFILYIENSRYTVYRFHLPHINLCHWIYCWNLPLPLVSFLCCAWMYINRMTTAMWLCGFREYQWFIILSEHNSRGCEQSGWIFLKRKEPLRSLSHNIIPVLLTPRAWSVLKPHPARTFQSAIGCCKSLFFSSLGRKELV